MAGFCRNDVENLTLPNKNTTLLSNVRFSTSFQPITKKRISGLFLPLFLFSFGGLKNTLAIIACIAIAQPTDRSNSKRRNC